MTALEWAGVVAALRDECTKLRAAASAWIADVERRPDADGWYAALVGGSKRPRMLYYSRGRGGQGWVDGHGCPNVRYWMPLPALPEEYR